MKLDLLIAIELTASAAIAITSTALLVGRTTRIRFAVAGILVSWFAWVIWLGQSTLLRPGNPSGLAVVGLSVGLPIFLLTFVVSRISELRAALREAPLSALVALNIIRVLGVSFLVLKAQGRVAPTFASSAGFGDIAAGLLAIPLAWLLATRRSGINGLVRIWNSFGLLDLVVAVSLAVLSSPGPLNFLKESPSSAVMTTLPWFLIPGFLVPLLASGHLAIYWKLKGLTVSPRSNHQLNPAAASGRV